MRFYNQQDKFYCGIDLHARKMYVCIIDQKGKARVHQNLKTDPGALFDILFPFFEDVVICVECMFSRYWVADFCSEHKIPFVSGHALYMKVIHGGKTKNDKIDSYKIAKLPMSGNLPPYNKNISRKFNHDGVAERFDDPPVRVAIEADLSMVEAFIGKIQYKSHAFTATSNM